MAVLKRNVGLRSLLLEWNQLAAKGGLDMTGALRENGDVQHLCLAWNSLGEDFGFHTLVHWRAVCNPQKLTCALYIHAAACWRGCCCCQA